MPQITAAFPTITPATAVRLPGQPPLHRRDRPLRSDNPQDNPDLAPRCGAKARTTGCPCPAPAMPSGRCRMHGGKSTGPRTPQGFADLARAHTTHGNHTAAARAKREGTAIIRTRTMLAATQVRAPTAVKVRVKRGPDELALPHALRAAVPPNQDRPRCDAYLRSPVPRAASRTAAKGRAVGSRRDPGMRCAAGPGENADKTPYTLARWRLRPARPAQPMRGPTKPHTPWHGDVRPARPGWQPAAQRSRVHPAAAHLRGVHESRLSEPTPWKLAQQPARLRRAKSPPRPHTPLHGGASDRPGRHSRCVRRQSPHAPWHGDVRPGRPGSQPAVQRSRAHPATGRPRRMHESRSPEPTLRSLAQPPARPRRAKSPPRPHTPLHGGASDRPVQHGQCVGRQNPLAPWHGDASGRVDRAGTPRGIAHRATRDGPSPRAPRAPRWILLARSTHLTTMRTAPRHRQTAWSMRR